MRGTLVGNIHLVAGGPDVIPTILKMLEGQGIKTHANADVFVREYQQFGIGEARELRERATSRAIQSDYRVFIISTPSMTNEAQNALLKTLEEPPANAMFFFVVASPQMLLATLRSRAQLLELSANIKKSEKLDVRGFLSANPQKRLDMLKVLLEKDDDDKRDIGAIVSFLSSLEGVLAKTVTRGNIEGVKAVYRARKFIGDKGALTKPLLEQVALLAPHV